MDEDIKNLGDWTDEATKQMLYGVIKRKIKFDQLYRFHLIIMWLTLGVLLLFIYYVYQTVILPYSGSFDRMFTAFVNHELNVYLLVFTAGLFGYMNLLKYQVDKAEKEFHALRCEIIDKSPDLWASPEAWKKRHIVFALLKEKYDINLYHENK